MKHWQSWIAIVATAGAVLACGSSTSSSGAKPDYRIDWIGDLTQAAAVNGEPDLSGFRTVIDTTNKAGGVNGHRIVLNVGDSAYDVSKGQVLFQNAVASGSLGIFGGVESVVWVPLAPKAQQAQIPMFNLSLTDNLIDPPQPYLYSLNLSYKGMATLQIGFIKSYLIKNNKAPAAPTLAIYEYGSPATATLNTFYKQLADTYGWRIVTTQTFSPSATDVSSQASAIAQAKPDVVLAAFLDNGAPLDVKSLRQKGYTGPIVDFVGASSPTTFIAVSDASYYSLRAYLSTVNLDQPGIKNIVDQAKATDNTVDMQSVYFSYGYVNASVVVAALKLCGDGCTAVKLNSALEKVGKVDVSGLNPSIQLSAQSHRAVSLGRFFEYDPTKQAEAPAGDWLDSTTLPS